MRLFLLSSAVCALAACSSAVIDQQASSSASGSGPGTGGNGTTSATSTSSSSTGGAPSCEGSAATLNLRIDGAAGVHACGVSPDFDHLEVDAAVQVLDEYTLQLDTCPPNADCTGTLSQLHVDAPVFAAGQPSGLFVHVSAAWSGKPGGPCDQRVELKNLPSWGGEQNPLAGWGDMLWFYGEDGQDEEASDLPFTVSWASLLCGQSAHEVGLFTFTDKTEPMNQVTIGEANHAGLTLKSSTNGAYAIDLHDVRSAKNLGTPDYAFWAIGTPLKD